MLADSAPTGPDDLFGHVISRYSRADALSDGCLIDLTQFSLRPNLNVCQEVGLKISVAMTKAAYKLAIGDDAEPLPPCQDLSGRMYDVVSMLRFAIAENPSAADIIEYELHVWNWVHTGNGTRTDGTKHEKVTLKSVIGPGDAGEPVVTIMLPSED